MQLAFKMMFWSDFGLGAAVFVVVFFLCVAYLYSGLDGGSVNTHTNIFIVLLSCYVSVSSSR